MYADQMTLSVGTPLSDFPLGLNGLFVKNLNECYVFFI